MEYVVKFPRPVNARYIRFHPKSYNSRVTLQLEYYGFINGNHAIQFIFYKYSLDVFVLVRNIFQDTVRGGALVVFFNKLSKLDFKVYKFLTNFECERLLSRKE